MLLGIFLGIGLLATEVQGRANPAVEQPPQAPCAACVVLSLTPAQAADVTSELSGLRVLVRWAGDASSAAALLASRGADTGFDLEEQDVAAFVERREGQASTVLLRLSSGPLTPERTFGLRKALTDLRALLPSGSIGIAPAEEHDSQEIAGLLPYSDFVVLPGGHASVPDVPVWRGMTASEPVRLEEMFAVASGSSGVVARVQADPAYGAGLAKAVWRLADVLPTGLSPLADVRSHGCETPGTCSATVYLHPQTLEAIIVVRPSTPVATFTFEPAGTGVAVQSLSGERDDVLAEDRSLPFRREATSDGSKGNVVFEQPVSGPFVVRLSGWRGGETNPYTEEVRVTAGRTLTAAEIVARHQAATARQRRLVARYIAEGGSVVTLEVPGFSAPVAITADTTLFSAPGVTEMEQRNIRVNGVPFEPTASGVPRLPIIEPERVTAAPLEIALNEMYSYTLTGTDTTAGRPCYLLSFAPRRADRSLFAGRACIDAETFGLARVSATQTGLRGPIVSSEQQDTFVPVTVLTEPADAAERRGAMGSPQASTLRGGRGPANHVMLLARSEVHQVYEGAGYRTPIHRVLTFVQHDVNPATFETRRAAAHAGKDVVLRETPEGYRYLQRRSGERVLARGDASAVQHVRTLVGGVILDPNITVPLPFAGLSYLDFNFLGTGAQFNGFFGGSFGQLAWSLPSIRRTRWQIGGSAFATAAEYNDRSFDAGIERYGENLRQRPANGTMWLLRPIGPRLWFRLAYEVDYKHLREADTTATDFVTPVSPLVHALRVSVDAQRRAWKASAWWNPGMRRRWAPWGSRPVTVDHERDFQRFGATLTRSLVFSRVVVGRVEAAAMGGRDLDRFSRYTFGTFENRLRGYPGASIRYDSGVVGRGAMSWTVVPGIRIDGFVDSALVRDPGLSRRYTGHTGLGGAVELPLPFSTLMAAEFGYGVQARNEDGSKGTKTFQITLFKVF